MMKEKKDDFLLEKLNTNVMLQENEVKLNCIMEVKIHQNVHTRPVREDEQLGYKRKRTQSSITSRIDSFFVFETKFRGCDLSKR